MEFRKWLVAAAVTLLGASVARADGKGEWQYSAIFGQGRMHIDADHFFTGQNEKDDTDLLGTSVGYKLPSGALFEAGYLWAEHADFGKDDDFISKQYYGGFGWQFESANGWRFRPSIGVTSFRLYNDARLLLDDNGTRHFWVTTTAPYAEVALLHRLGRHFGMGAMVREMYGDFVHHRTWGLVMTFNF